MPAAYRAQTKKANSRKEEKFLRLEIPNPDQETFQSFQEAFRRLCLELTRQADDDPRDPIRPSKYLNKRAKVSGRHANNILNGTQDVTLKVLWPLLRGQHGARFLGILFDSLRTDEAMKLRHHQKVLSAQRKAEEAHQELRDLEGRP